MAANEASAVGFYPHYQHGGSDLFHYLSRNWICNPNPAWRRCVNVRHDGNFIVGMFD